MRVIVLLLLMMMILVIVIMSIFRLRCSLYFDFNIFLFELDRIFAIQIFVIVCIFLSCSVVYIV
ncbi:hypothetical protein FB192DRAFT_1403225 [Mucor lusitanicus]|uniref:Uncharacterized protein n=1 Tax=Mucor circinelloides f. lusitanicus TaxID=29924 RepID=A0A8H4B6K9_MUCCL|nr:hypothetical protein FB192DRAFT_1403225 [Mucor lusitanicus]